MHNLAFKANEPCVPKDRWIATLSDGSTVFQNNLIGEKSAWRRLNDYLQERHLYITSLRLEAYGHTVILPRHDMVDGYWQAHGITAFLGPVKLPQSMRYGIGTIKDNILSISWITDAGRAIKEERPYNPTKDSGVILKLDSLSTGAGKSPEDFAGC